MTTTKNRFEYQKPTEQQVSVITYFRERCKDMEEALLTATMEPRCRARALTKLEEMSMWANRGIVFAEPSGESHGA